MSINTIPGMDLNTLINYLRSAMGQASVPPGSSDPLSQAYLQAQTQQMIAALNASTNLANQNQGNLIQWAQLFGTDPAGNMTDPAQRWRQELQAQQAVQNQKLQQDYAQLMGVDPTTGTQTLGGRTLQQQAEQAEKERQLRLALQTGQLTQQESEFARNYLLQQEASRRAQSQLMGRDASGNLTEAARAARTAEANQRAQIGASLVGTPKDYYKAAAYFHGLRQGDRSLPETMGLGDLYSQVGAPSGVLGAGPTTVGGGTGGGGTGPITPGGGGGGGGGAQPFGMGSSTLAVPPGQVSTPNGAAALAASSGAVPSPDPTAIPLAQSGTSRRSQEEAGLEPGGPVGSPTMGAGGHFLDREPPPGSDQPPTHLPLDPQMQAMLRQIDLLTSLAGGKGKGKSKGKSTRAPAGSQPGGPDDYSDSSSNQSSNTDDTSNVSGEQPNASGPGGTVDAGSLDDLSKSLNLTANPGAVAKPVDYDPAMGRGILTTPDPTAQTYAQLGTSLPPPDPTGTATPLPGGTPSDLNPLAGWTSLFDPETQRHLDQMGSWLQTIGVQGAGPQWLESRDPTQQQLDLATIQALGLSPDDFLANLKRHQFANTGSALSA